MTRTAAVLALALAAVSSPLTAQDPVVRNWFAEVGPGLLLIDKEIAPSGRDVSPALRGAVGYAFGGRFRLVGEGWIGRRGFDLAGDHYRRTTAFVGVGAELALVREPGVEFGVGLTVGAGMEDDANTTDPGFRSSANWVEAVSPGLFLRVPLTSRLGIGVTARDQIEGLVGELTDPSEGAIRHSLVVGLGLVIR